MNVNLFYICFFRLFCYFLHNSDLGVIELKSVSRSAALPVYNFAF